MSVSNLLHLYRVSQLRQRVKKRALLSCYLFSTYTRSPKLGQVGHILNKCKTKRLARCCRLPFDSFLKQGAAGHPRFFADEPISIVADLRNNNSLVWDLEYVPTVIKTKVSAGVYQFVTVTELSVDLKQRLLIIEQRRS